jgi:hypothetical protein
MTPSTRKLAATRLSVAMVTLASLTLPASPPSLDSSIIKPAQAASITKPPQF